MASRVKAISVPTTPTAYQLHVSLKDIKPPIWRRILVPGEYTMELLHGVLQRSFGWTNSHLHDFAIGKKRFGTPSEDHDLEYEGDERVVRLRDVLSKGDRFTYQYDFGDSWDHEIVVEAVGARVPGDGLPVCLAGARACPPEDCGGVPGYEDLLAALKSKRKTAEEKERLEWAGDWSPENFDLEATNGALQIP